MKTSQYKFIDTVPNQFYGNSAFPDNLQDGVVYVCREYRQAVFNCPCGCGEKVFINVEIEGGPSWTIQGNSIDPSVRKTSGCRSHFYITNGIVKNCD